MMKNFNSMKKKTLFCSLAALVLLSACAEKDAVISNSLRAPAYPLVSIDPYTSAWSASDHLYDAPVQHWTGKEFPLIGALKVDGEVYRFMGTEDLEFSTLLRSGQETGWKGKYTFTEPKGDWTALEFNDSRWQDGEGAFGTGNYSSIHTDWTSEDIWIRRPFVIDEITASKKVYLLSSCDDIAEFYINGVRVRRDKRVQMEMMTALPEEAAAALRQGTNVIAAKCKNTGGEALLDVGLMIQTGSQSTLEKTAVQKFADVQATQTHYGFTCGPVDLTLSFTAPLFLDNLDLVSRPVNYITYNVKANDGKKHEVQVYFEASPRWAVDYAVQQTETESFEKNGLVYLKAGTLSQNVLAKKGDDRRIDWGYFYLVSEKEGTDRGVGKGYLLRQAFKDGKPVSGIGTKGNNDQGRMALVRDLGTANQASGKVMIGYDDLFSIQYFGENLRPYWNADGKKTIQDAFEAANKDYAPLIQKCYAFDRKLMKDAQAAGGVEYAELCALAYRQAIHAHKLVKASNGDLLWLSKENNSNGSIGTVDVTYPSAPLFLLYNPKLAEGLMNHIYYYAESGRWTKPFPSHDVGTYPLANGQTYGADMPVEEAGNMLTLTAAVCHYEKSAAYAKKHWEVLTKWTEYLSQFGLDPENQLCTDDFAGRLAHNINLSAKAILGIASYGYMAGMLGDKAAEEKYMKQAREMAAKWQEMADDGDHFRLTFDRPGTWSQKYNLVWDKLLGFNIFPKEVLDKEIAYYKTVQNEYGLPLDNRATYTKTDWIMWTATLADNMEDFQTFVKPVHKFMNETVDRVAMSDWTFTDKPTHRGFKARSVVGGYFIKMLEAQK